jgi:IS30 family transposase
MWDTNSLHLHRKAAVTSTSGHGRKPTGIARDPGRHLTPEVEAVAREKLNRQWSPKQISDRLRRNEKNFISHERMYQFVQADRKAERIGAAIFSNMKSG